MSKNRSSNRHVALPPKLPSLSSSLRAKAKQSIEPRAQDGLLRRVAPRNDDARSNSIGCVLRENVMPGPLNGVRVLDLTGGVSGPFASMFLADQGADVLKIDALGGEHTHRR